MKSSRLIVGISGGSGAILGIRLLDALRSTAVETHLILTPSARLTIEQETDWKVSEVLSLANVVYNYRDIGAAVASGSFDTQGMVVIPCSIKSLSAIANSFTGNLLTRAADVTCKEGRPLILVVREAPLHPGHIRLMYLASRSGAVIFPPVPAFYSRPQDLNDISDNIVGRVLARIGIQNDLYLKWSGLEQQRSSPENWPPVDILSLPYLTLATVDRHSTPHAASLYFVADKENKLYFFSDKKSQHSQDLTENTRAAVTISPLVNGWKEIRGLQMRGTVRRVFPGEEWEQAWKHYLAKFPFVKDLADIVVENHLFVFIPEWIRLVDNTKGFGNKEERTYPREEDDPSAEQG
jgi:flavin prenyltransferase